MRRVEKRTMQELFHFEPYYVQRLRINRVGLGQHGDSTRDRKHPANVEMFAGLRLDSFVGSDGQQHQIDASDSCQHVPDESLVSGNIHEAHPYFVAIWTGQFQVGKADVDGDTTAFFFSQPVGINASERLDQRGLAVIDVPRGAHDN
jgi:hypothetical protein